MVVIFSITHRASPFKFRDNAVNCRSVQHHIIWKCFLAQHVQFVMKKCFTMKILCSSGFWFESEWKLLEPDRLHKLTVTIGWHLFNLPCGLSNSNIYEFSNLWATIIWLVQNCLLPHWYLTQKLVLTQCRHSQEYQRITSSIAALEEYTRLSSQSIGTTGTLSPESCWFPFPIPVLRALQTQVLHWQNCKQINTSPHHARTATWLKIV